VGRWDQVIEQIGDRVVRELALRGQVRPPFQKGAVVIQEGTRGDSMYVILAGKAHVYVSNVDGKEMILDDLGPGEYFGEMSLDGSPRSASVRAVETLTCSVIDSEALLESIKQNPELALNLIKVLIERARAATESVKELALSGVYERVRNLLNSLAHEAPDGRKVIPEAMTQQAIASRVGAGRDMVNRICTELVRGGYISVSDRVYTILRKLPDKF
jgi:CRP/FNR family cyclic AMP-dependent transcriptional regulator